MLKSESIISDTSGDAVVETAILFPIMIMIFAALVLLAMYLPTRAVLQRATQYAATAIATEMSDAWLFYDHTALSYTWEQDKSNLKNVYAELFSGSVGNQDKIEDIVTAIEERGISVRSGALSVDSYIVNKVVYKEVVVTATREFEGPVDLSFIGFPKTIPITVTSTAVVQNGDEFIRNVDIVVDFAEYILKKYELQSIAESISSFFSRTESIFGW